MCKWLFKIFIFWRKKEKTKVIYERVPGTEREMLIRTIYPDGREVHTIALLFPPNFLEKQKLNPK